MECQQANEDVAFNAMFGMVEDRSTLPKVAGEMALHVLAYNLMRVMNIMGIPPLIAAIREIS